MRPFSCTGWASGDSCADKEKERMNRIKLVAVGAVLLAATNSLAYMVRTGSLTLDDCSYEYTYTLYDNGTSNVVINTASPIKPDVSIPSHIDGAPVTTIGDWAFANYGAMTSVAIPSTVMSINHRAFFNCTGLTAVHITDLAAWCRIRITSYDADLRGTTPLYFAQNLYLNGELVTDLVVPFGVTRVNEGFAYYTNLTSVAISNNCEYIAGRAFAGCMGLKKVDVGDSVKTIGEYAFSQCQKLNDVAIGNGVTIIGEGAFASCDRLRDVTIPESVTGIGNGAFRYSGLTNIVLNCAITGISPRTFSYCKFKRIEIPDTVTSIGQEAFLLCSEMEDITIPDLVESIGARAFQQCYGIQSIAIPSNVKTIDNAAFFSCTNLSQVIFAGNAPTVGENAFRSVKAGCTAYVPLGSTGWGVDIPGMWNGVNIAYLFSENTEVDAGELPERIAVRPGVDVTVKVDHDMLVAELKALVARCFALSRDPRQDSGYFTISGDYDAVKSTVNIKAIIDAAKIGMDRTLAEVAGEDALSTFRADGTMRLTAVKDGFYYGVAAAEDIAGLDAAVEAVKAKGLTKAEDGEVSLSLEKPTGGRAFFKVVVSDSAHE